MRGSPKELGSGGSPTRVRRKVRQKEPANRDSLLAEVRKQGAAGVADKNLPARAY